MSKCKTCGETDGTAYWSDVNRTNVIRRCDSCGANSRGDNVFVSSEWAKHSALGLYMSVDPHLGHGHGHMKCNFKSEYKRGK
jgi:hypothetical protein